MVANITQFLKPSLMRASVFIVGSLVGMSVATAVLWKNRNIQEYINHEWLISDKPWKRKAWMIASSAAVWVAFSIGPLVSVGICSFFLIGLKILPLASSLIVSILSGIGTLLSEVKIYRFAMGKQMDLPSYISISQAGFGGDPSCFDREDSPVIRQTRSVRVLVFDLERPTPPGSTPPRSSSSEV